MTVIFKEVFNKDSLVEKLAQHNLPKKVFNFIKSNKILMRACCLCLIGMMAVGVSIVSVGITLGFKVNYAGAFIATVRNTGVFDDAKNIVAEHIESNRADSAIKTPSFKMTLTVSDRLDNAFKLADAIIENTNDIVEVSALFADGEQLALAETDVLETALEVYRTRFEVAGAENTSEFVNDIKTEKGYYLKSEVCDNEELSGILEGLAVKTVSVVATDSAIPFSKKTVKTSKEYIGYSKVTTAGKNGLSRKTESIETINGAEVSRTELSNVVLSNPVEQVTTIGTAKTLATPAQRSEERSSGFICPLKRGKFVISSYYGDGRGHKGMDLAADKGTPIYAAAGGKVILSKYDNKYGNSVVIDHGNGFQTRYAHASALCVSVGQTVAQGDVIAYVGSTGYSSGNHLHIEIIRNGNRINPVSYLGLD